MSSTPPGAKCASHRAIALPQQCCVCLVCMAMVPTNSSARRDSGHPNKVPLIFRNDSAGAKGGPLAGPPFSLRRAPAKNQFTAGCGFLPLSLCLTLPAKALTGFRESATGLTASRRFSRGCPLRRPFGILQGTSAQCPFSVIFGSWTGGLKPTSSSREKPFPRPADRSILASLSPCVFPTVHRSGTIGRLLTSLTYYRLTAWVSPHSF